MWKERHEDFVHSYRIVLSDSNGKAVSFGEGEDLTGEKLREILHDERSIELAMEGRRFHDMRL